MTRILKQSEIQLAADFAVGYGVPHKINEVKRVQLTPTLESILQEQDRVSYEAGKDDAVKSLLTDMQFWIDHSTKTCGIQETGDKLYTIMVGKYKVKP